MSCERCVGSARGHSGTQSIQNSHQSVKSNGRENRFRSLFRISLGHPPHTVFGHLPAPSRSAGAVHAFRPTAHPWVCMPCARQHRPPLPLGHPWRPSECVRGRRRRAPEEGGGLLAAGGRHGVPTKKKRIRRLVLCAWVSDGDSPLHNVHNPFPGSQAEDVHGPPHGGMGSPGYSLAVLV